MDIDTLDVDKKRSVMPLGQREEGRMIYVEIEIEIEIEVKMVLVINLLLYFLYLKIFITYYKLFIDWGFHILKSANKTLNLCKP